MKGHEMAYLEAGEPEDGFQSLAAASRKKLDCLRLVQGTSNRLLAFHFRNEARCYERHQPATWPYTFRLRIQRGKEGWKLVPFSQKSRARPSRVISRTCTDVRICCTRLSRSR